MRPIVDFAIGLSGIATIAIAVVAIVFAVLAYTLIMRRDVAPVLKWGRLEIDFKRLGPRRRNRR